MESESLIVLAPSEMRELVAALGPEQWRTYLDDQIKPWSEMATFLREERIEAQAPPPDTGARLLKWVLRKKATLSKEAVRTLSSSEKWLLDAYIAKQHPDRKVNFDSEVDFWHSWVRSRSNGVEAARSAFAAFAARSAAEPDFFANSPDQHEAHYQRLAFDAFIEAHPPLARLQSEGWRFEGLSFAKLGTVLDALVKPLPGAAPVLTYFIDPKAPDHDLMTDQITAAWRQRSETPPSYLLSGDVERFLESMRGQTVILVGHIVDQYFAMERGAGKSPLMLEIPALLAGAAQHQVLLLPIGCNSGKSGAPYGFTRPIDSNEIANFIAAIPRSDIQVADLLAAMGKIGTIVIDDTHFADHLDVVLRPRPALTASDEPVALVRIPASAYAPPGPGIPPTPNALPGFQQFTTTWIAVHRPWHDSGWLGVLRTFTRNTRGAGLAAIALLLAALYGALRLARRKIEGTTAPTSTRLHRIERVAAASGIVLGSIAVLYAAISALWLRWPVATSLALLLLVSAGLKSLSEPEES